MQKVGKDYVGGTIHRSDDDGKTWRVISVIRRRKPEDDKWLDTDEGKLGRFSNGRLVLVARPDGGTLVSDDEGVKWRQISRVGPTHVYAPSLVVLTDNTIVLTAGGSGGQCVFLSTDRGENWSDPIQIDQNAYGYGRLTLLEDESILLAYVEHHGAPQRCLMVRFKVNAARDGAELLAIGE